MERLHRLIHEVHRRSLWQVLGIYLGAGWLVLQVVEHIVEGVGLPTWVHPFAIILLLIGLPIVLATAFVQEGIAAARGPSGGGGSAGPGRGRGAGREPAASQPAAGTRTASVAAAAPGGGAEPPAHRRLLTWRNALLGGILAFATLGAVTAGYMALRSLGIGPAGTLVAKGLLEDRSTVLVADFESGDSLLSRAVSEALRVDLSQSPVVRVAQAAFVADALTRMRRESDETLDLPLARDLARREGVPAVLAGDITPAGGGYVITARLVSAEKGEVLLSHRETAADSAGIIPAIDRLSKRFRERIGESLRSLRGSPPLERVTTSSLAALQRYSLAIRAWEFEGDWSRGDALIEEALALDTAFAMAWRRLGIELANRQEQPGRAREALRRAYEYRDRLTERERYYTIGSYHHGVSGDYHRAAAAYESLLELDPEDYRAANNLGVARSEMRDPARGLEAVSLAARLDSTTTIPLTNGVEFLVSRGELARADSLMAATVARFPGNPIAAWYAAQLDAVEGNYEGAETALLAVLEGAPPGLGAGANSDLAAVAAARGRVAAARARLERALRLQEERRLASEYLAVAVQTAWLDLLVAEDAPAARRRLDEALARHPLSEAPPSGRPYLLLAEVYAWAGDPARAARLVEAGLAESGPELPVQEDRQRRRVLGAIAAARGDYGQALEELRLSDRGECVPCARLPLARVYELAGARDSAIAAWRAFVAPYLLRHWGRARPTLAAGLGPAHERLARLLDERGDAEGAALHFARFAELWEDADPELQPRVEAARRRLREILAERG